MSIPIYHPALGELCIFWLFENKDLSGAETVYFVLHHLFSETSYLLMINTKVQRSIWRINNFVVTMSDHVISYIFIYKTVVKNDSLHEIVSVHSVSNP